jgi:hypothetical protein
MHVTWPAVSGPSTTARRSAGTPTRLGSWHTRIGRGRDRAGRSCRRPRTASMAADAYPRPDAAPQAEELGEALLHPMSDTGCRMPEGDNWTNSACTCTTCQKLTSVSIGSRQHQPVAPLLRQSATSATSSWVRASSARVTLSASRAGISSGGVRPPSQPSRLPVIHDSAW